MRIGASAPMYPKGSNLRSVSGDPPGARGSGCGEPYWAAACGRGTEKDWGHALRLRGGGLRRDEMRGIPYAPDVKTCPPGAECVLRLRSGLEKGKRLSGTNGETHSKALHAGRATAYFS